ncbi:hypothetical protein MHM83_15930 [Tenacibaculum sp. Mcav3-52]|uniref:Uncharacterized protein n=1 Tax=Tenacibaculum sp. Pbs-1 TaxID=3238748 RepID=A0AB33KT05_9FLAO|nr:hypothetical protein [Tenacibaculum sp. Mcav3-52]MCG7503357.1 hypothetical protein [Tenacibaculum sp. Mcav3-52]
MLQAWQKEDTANELLNNKNLEVKEIFSKLREGNNDEDNGMIAFRNEGESLRLVFFRSLEEDFIISEDISLRDYIAKELGKTNITLQANKYVVDYSRFKNGEVLIPLKKLKN